MNRAKGFVLLGALIGLSLASAASAQQAVRWEPTLDSATRLAGQTNRMVLVHFWAEWCKPCATMDREVFSRPDVAEAIERGFVPVKVNVDHFPAKVRQYGVSIVPTDVVISPDGQLVDKLIGKAEASQYIARLNQIAQDRSTAARGAHAAAAPAESAAPYGQPSPTGYQPPSYQAPQEQYSDSRTTDYYGGQSPAAAAPPAYGQPAPSAMASQPAPAAASPASDYQGFGAAYRNDPPPSYQAEAAAPYGASGAASQPAASAPAYDRNPAAAYQGAPAVGAANPAMPSYQADATPSYGSGQDAAQSPYGGSPSPSYETAPVAPAYGNQPAQQPWQSTPAEPSVAEQLPPGSPPLAMEGYCPVRLTNEERWIKGDIRWGARHEDRTYLFAGPEEQKRFLASPESYAPVLAGNDVVLAVDQRQMVPGRREFGAWYHGKVYLFSSDASFRQFDANPDQYIQSVEQMASGSARQSYGAPATTNRQPQAPAYGARY